MKNNLGVIFCPTEWMSPHYLTFLAYLESFIHTQSMISNGEQWHKRNGKSHIWEIECQKMKLIIRLFILFKRTKIQNTIININ